MAKKKQNDEPQSQSIPGPTADNPNEDGQQSTIQPGTGSGNTVGGESTGDGNTPAPTGTSVPSDGGNAAANQGGSNAPAGPNQ
jgi:hypothetical protein